MPRLDNDTRRRIVILHDKGYCVSDIRTRFSEQNIVVSHVSIYKLLKRNKETGVISQQRKTVPKVLNSEHLRSLMMQWPIMMS